MSNDNQTKIIAGIIAVAIIFSIAFVILSNTPEPIVTGGDENTSTNMSMNAIPSENKENKTNIPLKKNITIEMGDTVNINYVVKFENGTVFNNANSTLVVGAGTLFPEFDKSILGMNEGDKKTVTFSPENAYGKHDPDKTVTLDKSITLPRFINVSVEAYKNATGKEPAARDKFRVPNIPWDVEIAAIMNDTMMYVDTLPDEKILSEKVGNWIVHSNRNEIILSLNVGGDPVIGKLVRTEDGNFAKITKINETTITFDLNHPLAGKNLTFDITVFRISRSEVSYISDTISKEGFNTFKSYDINEQICLENGKPLILLFSTTNCPHCVWIKPTFDNTVAEYVKSGKIFARHWEVNINDDTLTPEAETMIPDSDLKLYYSFNPGKTVPTFIFGCKYYRVGTGYERQKDLTLEEKEFREIIEHLIERSEGTAV